MNSVTGVNNRLMMAVMEVMVTDAHVDRVWMDTGDVVMEKVIQIMMKRSWMKRVVRVRYRHYRGRRGWGKMARDEEVINVLDLSGSSKGKARTEAAHQVVVGGRRELGMGGHAAAPTCPIQSTLRTLNDRCI